MKLFFRKSDRGAAGSQYALIVGLVAVIAIVSVTALGTSASGLLRNTANTLTSASNGTISGGGSGGGAGPVTPPAVPDTTPDPFEFEAQSGVARSTVVTSNTIAVHGIDTPAPVAVSGGEYAVNGGPFGTAPGTVNVDDTIQLRQTSSAQFGTLTTTTLTVGSVQRNFYVSTLAADTTPDPFAFAPQTDAPLGSTAISAPVTLSGLNAPASISVAGGTYSINGGAFGTAAGSVADGCRERASAKALAASARSPRRRASSPSSCASSALGVPRLRDSATAPRASSKRPCAKRKDGQPTLPKTLSGERSNTWR